MYEVRVFDGEGNLKEIIEPKDVAKKMWERQKIEAGTYGVMPEPEKIEMGICKLESCKKPFPIKQKGQLFCKGEGPNRNVCYKTYYRNSVKVPQYEKECATCGKLFMGFKARRYCNDPCYGDQ